MIYYNICDKYLRFKLREYKTPEGIKNTIEKSWLPKTHFVFTNQIQNNRQKNMLRRQFPIV